MRQSNFQELPWKLLKGKTTTIFCFSVFTLNRLTGAFIANVILELFSFLFFQIWGRIKKKYHLFESKSVPTSTSEKVRFPERVYHA